MNVSKTLVQAIVIGCLTAQASFAIAQDDNSIFGTHSVAFQTIRSSGVLEGCSLVYTAVQADHAYKKGGIFAINGNIGVFQGKGAVILSLKIGINDFNSSNAAFTRPYFAYLQTVNETTVKSFHEASDGEEGYRLFVFKFDEASTKLIFEMLDSDKVTIAFNRKKGGIDVLVPIDLTVLDTDYSTGNVTRKRSNEGSIQFLKCFREIIKQAKQAISEKVK